MKKIGSQLKAGCLSFKQSKTFLTLFFCVGLFIVQKDLIHAAPIFTGNFGTPGAVNGQFNSPSYLAIDTAGNLYVTDTGNSRVQKFDTLGMYISQFGTNGAGDGQFDSPVGIAISSTGDIYVGDGNYNGTSNSRIQIFNPNGTFKSKFGSEGVLPGEFNDIEGITLDSTGKLYTADYNNSRVQVFPPNTTIPTVIFGPGQLTGPEGVVVNSAGKIYVSDYDDGRVKLFNAIGAFESEVGNGPGAGNGQFNNPQGLALSNANGGRLYVGDSANHRVQVFDSTGTFQYTFGTNVATPDGMRFPLGVTVEPTTGKIYVVDVAPNRSRVTVWFDPTEWTQAGTSKVVDLPLNQPLTLNNGFNLQVSNLTTLTETITLNPGGTFLTNFLRMDGGSIRDAANTTFNFFIQLSTNGGTFSSGLGNVLQLSGTIQDDPSVPLPVGELRIVGGGTTALTNLNPNTYTGGTVVTGTVAQKTTLLVDHNNQLGTGGITLDNGILKTTADFTSARTFTLNAGGGTFDTNGLVSTFSGLIQGAGLFTIRGGGLARFTTPVANTYSGGTLITGNALLNVQRNDQLGTGNVILDNGTLRTLAANFATNKTIILQGAGAISNTAPANQLNLSGLITGPGLLTLQGGGTTFLTNPGANTYTGGTILKSATIADPATTLVVDRDNQLGTGSFTFDHGILKPTGAFASARAFSLNIGGGTLDTNGQNVTLSGLISGSGPFTKDGLGELKITNANNSFGGGIVVNGGTLTGEALTLTTSTIQNNAALVFDQQNAGTFSGNIVGRGFVKTGPGILTMTGNYASLTTPVSIQAGEVVFTQSAPNGIDLAPATILDFSPPAGGTLTYGGQISGAGGVEVEGLGKLTMTGNQTYTGPTSIRKGTLALNGTVRNSDVFVSPGATLMGNGTMASLILEGTIAPGNSIGTQTILGNYTMTPTSIYEAEVDPNGTSDLIDVGGTATLGGTLDVISDKPRQALKSTPYTILTANQGVIGKFTSTISSNRVKYTVRYLPNAVQILTAAHQDFVDLFGLADTGNVARTGRYLDTFADTVPATSDLGQIIQLLDGMLLTGNVAGLTNALDQIQPSQYRETGLLSFLSSELVEKNVQLQQQYLRETHHLEGELRKLDGVCSKRAASFYKLVNDTLSKGFNFARIQENRVGPKRSLLSFLAPHGVEGSGMPGSQRIRLGQSSVWFQAYGQIHEKNSSNGNVGLRSQTGGFSLGADHEIMPNTFVGLFGGLSTTPFKWKSGRGNGHMNSYYGGLYGTWMSRGGLYVDGQVIAGQDRYRSNRTINFAGINRSATESHYGNQFSVDTEIGYACDMPVVTVQPYVGASYMVVRENGYTESGANGLNFSIKPKTSQFARGAIGAQFYRTFVCGETLLRPALQLAFVRKQPIGSSPADLNGGFVNQPQTLTVVGDNKARNQFAPGVSLTTQFRNGAYLIANVSGQVFSGQNSGEALLKVGYDF